METLSDTHQMMIVNAACHAIAMNQENERHAGYLRTRPHVILNARIFRDGAAWCCLYGENIQDGVVGFGETPAKAADAFDAEWDGAKRSSGGTPRMTHESITDVIGVASHVLFSAELPYDTEPQKTQ